MVAGNDYHQSALHLNHSLTNAALARQRFNEAFTHRRSQLRRQWMIGSLLMMILIGISSVIGEVNLVHLWDRLPRFTSYFGTKFAKLENNKLIPFTYENKLLFIQIIIL